MSRLFHQTYGMPLFAVIVLIILLIIAWAVLAVFAEDSGKERIWMWINRLLLLGFILVIISRTLYFRSTGEYSVQWQLFGKLKAAATVQPEYYREMLMNLFLFVPFGLFAPFALKKPGRDKKAAKQAGIVILIGFLFSVLIELLQMAFSIGLPEVEDVLFNTAGAAIGTGAFAIWKSNRRIRHWFLSV